MVWEEATAASHPLGRCSFARPAATRSGQDDASFLSALGELRNATYADKGSIVERLGEAGHRSLRAVLMAFLEDRLCYRNADEKVFLVKKHR